MFMKYMLQGATALAALTAAAPAFATEGWYGRIDLGYSFDANGDLSGSNLFDAPPFSTDPEINPDNFFALDRFIPGNNGDLDGDWIESIGMGYAFVNSGFRVEGEIAHRYDESSDNFQDFFDPDPFFIDPFVRLNRDKWHVWSYMVNGYYDFNKGSWWEPYVGAGIGIDQVVVSQAGTVANVVDLDDGLVVSASNFRVNDDDWAFAWQLMAGVAFRATEQLMIDVSYRYHQTDGAEVDGVVFEEPVIALVPQEFFTQDADYDNNAVMVGLRWQFSAPEPPPPPYAPPPPPPPPPPPACPTQDFVVYFEWDRSNLNQAALDTIDQAVNQARACNLGDVLVIGHADTSGGADYNVGLSERRASVVRDALTSRGVPAQAIRTEARGETDLAKPTPDGVREPLNRRTAVTISFR
jgi:outer membrane protein OmpA-like peptidoglycan-associated protein